MEEKKILIVFVIALYALSIFGGGTVSVRADEEGKHHIGSYLQDAIRDYTNYSMTVYDASNGLMNSSANAIAETKDGFIWIGISNGLVRYDGRSFERIDPTGNISNVLSLYTDSADRLWVGTSYSGAIVLSGNETKTYDRTNGLESLTVKAIAEDKNGNIYLGTNTGIGVIAAKDGQLSMMTDERIRGKSIRSFKKSDGGVVYGLTSSGDVVMILDGRVTDFFSADNFPGQITAILPDPENPDAFYMADGSTLDINYCTIVNGELVFDTFKDLIIKVNTIEASNGAFWVGTGYGILIFLKDGTEMSIPKLSKSVENILFDYQGNIWLSSSESGLIKFTANRFYDYYGYLKLGLSYYEPNVSSFAINGDRIFISGNNGSVEIYTKAYGPDGVLGWSETSPPIDYIVNTKRETTPAESLDLLFMDEKLVNLFLTDSRGRLWICASGNYPLLCYNGIYVESYDISDGLPSNNVYTMIERADGSFAAACEGGLVLISGNKISDVYGKDSFMGADPVTLAENAAGELVIGTDGEGIFILGKNGLTHIDAAEGLPSDFILKLKKDRTLDTIWIISGNSVAYMNSDCKITTVSGFPYTDNYDLFENDKGDMWFLGSNGIYTVPKSEMLENKEINAIHYDLNNGLPFPVASNSESLLTDEGYLYIAGQKGIIKVNINDTPRYYDTIKMSIPYADADGTRIYPDADGTFVIDPEVKRLTVNSYVCNYTLAEPVITYRLDGFEDIENSVLGSGSIQAVYTNLKGGDYSFTVSLSDIQNDYENTVSVKIVKKLALYEQLWFKILAAAAAVAVVVAAIALYYRHKIKIFSKKAEENKNLVREIVEAFAKVIDMKDKYTNGHSSRVADYTVMLAKELGYDQDTIDNYRNIALMHDIGKVGVPGDVLNKPGKLSDDEYHVIQTHSPLGYDTLKGISIMPDLAEGARSHHERPDGKGYPRGLKGNEIPRVAQLIAVADTFDAMYSNRPYRKRMNFDRAVSIIQENSGTQFETDVVDAFMRLVEKGILKPAQDDNGGGTTENIDNIRKNNS
ncbi:MAG: HD domain-containing protein [Lachnospiraceae bacterium]|nr:HD domain-containing protein [Lachnospiraceae bacterium]